MCFLSIENKIEMSTDSDKAEGATLLQILI